jgi:hypothetical protein
LVITVGELWWQLPILRNKWGLVCHVFHETALGIEGFFLPEENCEIG